MLQERAELLAAGAAGVTAQVARRARRSSAPCRMKAAACWSITSARFLRLTSASIRSRSTATVERPLVPQSDRQLGQARKIARKGTGRLRARAFAAVHVDGQAEHDARCFPLGRKRQQAGGIGREALRAMVSTPAARPAIGSLAATPMVLVPRSSPISAPRAGSSGAISTSGRIGAGMSVAYQSCACDAKACG